MNARKPDYTQLLKVLNKQVPDRPTLFEFFLNDRLYDALNNGESPVRNDGLDYLRRYMYAYKNVGYDYAMLLVSQFSFPTGEKEQKSTISLNAGTAISDLESYEQYQWPEPEAFGQEIIEKLSPDLPEGMKIIIYAPGGVLENVIAIVGYENLCILIHEEPELVQKIFDDVGSRLVRYYEQAVGNDCVCAVMSNDDWGFKTQTMLSPEDMRKYVFPWHKKIVETAHRYNKPVILHSCGQLEDVMEDIIEDMGYDAKHSFEDTITPIEEAYEKYKGRIALLGGIDVDFMCTAAPEEISARAKALLAQTAKDGGFALGTGNSVPGYVPDDSYFAMINVI